MILVILWASLFGVFAGSYGLFYLYMKKEASKPWNLHIDYQNKPIVSIMVPAHNEEKKVNKKLNNLKQLEYPRSKLEIIFIDDGSTDATSKVAREFVEQNRDMEVKLLLLAQQRGKASALNVALKSAKGDVIAVTDADVLLTSDSLVKEVSYLADPKVGAVSAMGLVSNPVRSRALELEHAYLGLINVLRVGESKMDSTIRFEGGLCTFKKEAFDKFDDETGADDSGTALKIIQNHFRAIVVPEVRASAVFQEKLNGRIKVKSRRATHLMRLWIKCFKLLFVNKLHLSKRIAVGETMLFIFDPILFALLTSLGVYSILTSPFSPLSLFLYLAIVILLLFARSTFLEIVLDNLILIYALFSIALGRQYLSWKSIRTQHNNAQNT